jgi:agmatinase
VAAYRGDIMTDHQGLTDFDPSAAAIAGDAVFGLPHTRQQAGVILLPVPFDATTSYRPGTRFGPASLLTASAQVDLFDHRFGRIYERGIWMAPIESDVLQWSDEARALAEPLIVKGGAEAADESVLEQIDAIGERVRAFVRSRVAEILSQGKTPGVIGGEHSVPFGAIEACCDHFGDIGVLQVDAHMDFRASFEGFRWSHASIMHNVISLLPQVCRVVQVGIRDYCEPERDFGRSAGERVRTWFWEDIADALDSGRSARSLWAEVIEALPQRVYLTFDIDGLDPSLCPHTGTPVPGGLSFDQAIQLLAAVKNSGREVVGFDLVELAPGAADAPEWDANVGARLLYKMCALAREA